MDFFESQDKARRMTSLLVGYYVVAVILIVVGVYVAFAATFIGFKSKTSGEIDTSLLWNLEMFAWVAGGTLLVVIAGTLYKIRQLAEGGEAVARMMGGRAVSQGTTDPDERKLLNVVEEMAIASGVPVPRVFLLEGEDSINAFAAGFAAADAVVAATSGCIRQLSRDELQGVIAHEFSHVLNGDMRLNIRLMGVLNGILVIGMVGYWIMRSTLGAGRGSRSSKKGSSLPIVLLGLAVMVIGFIGVFFGKLIKSAVSRQREFLADASAVQFTRNPGGIGGALKKIGGCVRGSRLSAEHAEEASHFFFANGLSSGFLGLLATHPPLVERIRRIDPSFDGAFPSVKSMAAESRAEPPPLAAAGISQLAVDPGSVVETVGAPRPEHIEYAAGLLSALAPVVVDAAHEPFGARAVIYALLLNRDPEPRAAQLERLARHADEAVNREVTRLGPAIDALGDDCRLPVVDVTLPALRELSPSQYESFKGNVAYLVEADREIDLFEYALQRTIVRHLDPVFHRKPPAKTKYCYIDPVIPRCVELLSCLAGWGADTVEQAEAAFAAGARELMLAGSSRMIPPAQCGLQMLDEALDELVLAAPGIRKRVLTACIACIGADGKVTIEEAELIRAVADSLDCPVPPMMAGAEV